MKYSDTFVISIKTNKCFIFLDDVININCNSYDLFEPHKVISIRFLTNGQIYADFVIIDNEYLEDKIKIFENRNVLDDYYIKKVAEKAIKYKSLITKENYLDISNNLNNIVEEHCNRTLTGIGGNFCIYYKTLCTWL